MLTDNSNEFRHQRFGRGPAKLGATQTKIRAGRPQTNSHVERLHRTILEECWRPAFARTAASTTANTRGRPPADLVYGARKMEPR